MPRIKGKTVLVTGGAGFIGSHLADRLLAEGAAKVVVVDNFFLGKLENLEPARQAYGDRLVIVRDDARQLGVMQAVIEREQVEVVFNLATLQLKYSFFNPIDAYQVNVDIMKTHPYENGSVHYPDPYLHFRGIRNGGIRADGREPSSLPDHPLCGREGGRRYDGPDFPERAGFGFGGHPPL